MESFEFMVAQTLWLLPENLHSQQIYSLSIQTTPEN